MAVRSDAWLRTYKYTWAAAGIALLLATFLFGSDVNGARLTLSIGPVSGQPSELLKVILVVFLAGYLSDRLGKLSMLFVACSIAIPAIFFLPRVPMGLGLYGLLVLIGVFVFTRMPVSESFLFTHAPARQRATLLGVYFLGSSAGGGVLGGGVGSAAIFASNSGLRVTLGSAKRSQ